MTPSDYQAARKRVEALKPAGVVEALCKEIGFTFDPRLERSDVLIAFVRELVCEIADRRHMAEVVSRRFGKTGPSDGSSEVLELAGVMLAAATDEERIALAAKVHDACDRLNPDDAYPTDHLIDMVSSCASAVRFGLKMPAMSRHAAAAADHVWKQVYGISRFDRHTPAWGKAWAREKLLTAIVGMLPQAEAEPGNRKDGQ